MNLVKKILVLHPDSSRRRRLVLLLAGTGFDVRAFANFEAASQHVREEWFDLAVVDQDLSAGGTSGQVEQLRKVQPTMPIVLTVAHLELPAVVQGIRLGVAEVVPFAEDASTLLRRVRLLLKLPPSGDLPELSAHDVAPAEVALGQAPSGVAPAPADVLQHLSKENAAFANRVSRLEQEKAGLEAELKALLAQNMDSQRMEAELAGLRTERELAAATQAAIDEKARHLGELRAAVAAERQALEREKQATVPASSATAQEIAEIEAWRRKLELKESHLAESVAQMNQEAAQLAQERRRWHDDLEILRSQEENLRHYEARLRQIQAQLESDRVLWFSTSARPASNSPFASDAALKEAWTKLQRASELLEAEEENLKNDRLTLREREAAVKQREEQVRDQEIKSAVRERRLDQAPDAKPKRGFGVAKLVLGGG